MSIPSSLEKESMALSTLSAMKNPRKKRSTGPLIASVNGTKVRSQSAMSKPSSNQESPDPSSGPSHSVVRGPVNQATSTGNESERADPAGQMRIAESAASRNGLPESIAKVSLLV